MPRAALPEGDWGADWAIEHALKTADDRPWPAYDPAFVRAELERYEREEKELYDLFCAEREPVDEDARRKNRNAREVAQPYRTGLLTTYGWFLGLCNSPILDEPGPPRTRGAYVAEYLWAHNMTENSAAISRTIPSKIVYGGFNSHYVNAVYKTLRWVTATPEGRASLRDPMFFG